LKPGIIINQYPSQSYSTIFNQNSGLFFRLDDENGNDPFWCSYGPELIDISITNWCDKECSFCYKNSSRAGTHLNLDAYKSILQQAAQMKVLQVVLGGGNPNQHPDFCEILRLTRDEYNIIPSYTTNGRGLSEDILTATEKHCGAVAVSVYEPYDEAFWAIQKLLDCGIKTNIHFLLSSKSIDTAIEWLQDLPNALKGINAIIFLNYKPVGRNPNPKLLAKNSHNISTFFHLAGIPHKFKIGFDSCSISGIVRFINTSPIFTERCEAGRFSMYISEDNKMYPCSFMIGKVEGVSITHDNVQSVWRNHEVFTRIRDLLSQNSCNDCVAKNTCSGGCPIFPEINICQESDFVQ
jgi:radical SAM protein with 4Fe4S-binding SPASM domain